MLVRLPEVIYPDPLVMNPEYFYVEAVTALSCGKLHTARNCYLVLLNSLAKLKTGKVSKSDENLIYTITLMEIWLDDLYNRFLDRHTKFTNLYIKERPKIPVLLY